MGCTSSKSSKTNKELKTTKQNSNVSSQTKQTSLNTPVKQEDLNQDKIVKQRQLFSQVINEMRQKYPGEQYDQQQNIYFKTDQEIGKGSYAEIFKGVRVLQNQCLIQDIAIKIINYQQLFDRFPEQVEKLQNNINREIQIGMGINHNNIVKQHYVHQFLQEGQLYIYQELMDSDLKRLLAYCKDNEIFLSFNDVEFIFKQIVEAMAFMHREDVNIVHRDLKPENIMLKAHRNNQLDSLDQQQMFEYLQKKEITVKIVDFNTAKQILSQTGEISLKMTHMQGTIAYTSPEIIDVEYDQYEGEGDQIMDINLKHDSWSLGIILYQLLFNNFPFDIQNRRRFFNSLGVYKENQQFNQPDSREIPEQYQYLLEITRKCLNPNRQNRSFIRDIHNEYFVNKM